jgi:molybdenum cofactor cytidylyltransferase
LQKTEPVSELIDCALNTHGFETAPAEYQEKYRLPVVKADIRQIADQYDSRDACSGRKTRVDMLEAEKNHYAKHFTGGIFAILMASGFSKRFGNENKLLVPFKGKALARHTLDLVCGLHCFSGVFFIAADDQVAALAGGLPVTLIRNTNPEKGQRESVRLGVEAAGDSETAYYVFFPCDQPLLDSGTVRRILEERRPGRIVEPRFQDRPGNPCLFSGTFRDDLLTLKEGEKPRVIKIRHPDAVTAVEIVNPSALIDIDDPAMLGELTAFT